MSRSATAASPPPANVGDQWFDTGNGNRRCECAAVASWDASTGFTGWIATNATAAVTASWPDGSQALTVTASGAGNWLAASPSAPVSPGDVISATAMLYTPSVTLNDVSLGIAWYDSTSTLLSVTTGTVTALAAGAPGVYAVTGTAPASAASFTLQPGDAEASPAGTQMAVGNAGATRWVVYQAAAAALSLPITGAVDNTAVSGARVVAYGSTGEILVYSGTPAAGNLIASVSGAAGTDSNGNAYLAGVCNYTSGTPYEAVQTYQGVIQFLTATTGAGPWTVGPLISTDSSGDVNVGASPSYLKVGPHAGPVVGLPPGGPGAVVTVPLYAQLPGGPLGIAETWHSLTPGNSWTGTFSYRLTPENEVQISAVLTAPSSSPNGSAIVTLPAGYQPASLHGVGSTGLTLGTAGAVKGVSVTASATVYVEARIPLDI